MVPMTKPPTLQIAIIGGGIMGRSIAFALARAGHSIAIVEPSQVVAAAIPDQLKAAAAEDRSGGASGPSPELERVRVVNSLEDAVPTADLVIEAVPEDMELKKTIWAELSSLSAPKTILATNTSALDIDAIAAVVDHPERVLGTHWFNPAHVVPCVELVRASATSDETINRVQALLVSAGKKAVVVKNSPGFVANRIQFALVREALLCLEEGLATAEEIDTIVSSSFGVRLAALGPLANADLGGLDTYLAILSYLTRELGDRFEPPAMLDRLVGQGQLGVKTGSGIYQHGAEHYAALIRYRDLALRQVTSAVATSDLTRPPTEP